MIKIKKKPIDEIKSVVRDYSNVLIIGCGGCASVCLGGGQNEVNSLISELKVLYKLENMSKEITGYTVERQCNMKFLEDIDSISDEYDCFISMACGAGIQHLAERFTTMPVFPGVNTISIGIDRDIGLYEERCRACGECVLGYTGGVCPVTGCAKGLFNGPCGGTNGESCEVGKDIPCAWYSIYNRLKAQDRLDDIKMIQTPMQWKNQIVRTTIQEPYEKRYIPDK